MILVADGHALLDHPLHAAQADAQLVLHQLIHRLHPAVAQVIHIIGLFQAVVDGNHPPDDAHQIPLGDGPMAQRHNAVQVQLLVHLIATHLLEVVIALVKELLLHELPRILQRGRVARAHSLEELDQSRLGDSQPIAQIPLRLLTHGSGDEHPIRVVIHILKQGQNLFIRAGFDG